MRTQVEHEVEVPLSVEFVVGVEYELENTTDGHPDDYTPAYASERGSRRITRVTLSGREIDWTSPEWARVLPHLQAVVDREEI